MQLIFGFIERCTPSFFLNVIENTFLYRIKFIEVCANFKARGGVSVLKIKDIGATTIL